MAASFAGTIPAGASTDVNLLFETLLEFKWRAVSFPVVSFRSKFRQDLAIHKFADRDGAHVEGTGRAPIETSARIAFLNGLQRGITESWTRPLYPLTWRQFIEACADRTTGTLQHPELGALTCKLEVAEVGWDAHVRGGVYVDATWIETDDSTDSLQSALSRASPVAQAQSAAADLDSLTTVSPTAPTLPVFSASFTDLVNAVRAVVDLETLLAKSTGGRVDNIIYNCQQLRNSIEGANPANQNALNWPIVDAIEQLQSAAYDLKATQLTKGRTIAIFPVPKDAILSQVAATIPAPLEDVMTLNPALIQQPVVPLGTLVRYYAKAA